MKIDCSRLERREFLEKLTGKKFTSEELDKMETMSLKVEIFGDRARVPLPQKMEIEDVIVQGEW